MKHMGQFSKFAAACTLLMAGAAAGFSIADLDKIERVEKQDAAGYIEMAIAAAQRDDVGGAQGHLRKARANGATSAMLSPGQSAIGAANERIEERRRQEAERQRMAQEAERDRVAQEAAADRQRTAQANSQSTAQTNARRGAQSGSQRAAPAAPAPAPGPSVFVCTIYCKSSSGPTVQRRFNALTRRDAAVAAGAAADSICNQSGHGLASSRTLPESQCYKD